IVERHEGPPARVFRVQRDGLTDGLTRRAPAFAYQLTEPKSQVSNNCADRLKVRSWWRATMIQRRCTKLRSDGRRRKRTGRFPQVLRDADLPWESWFHAKDLKVDFALAQEADVCEIG